MKFKIVDEEKNEITVGTKIRILEFSRDGEVIKIIEPDVDYNDIVQRPTMTNPKIVVVLSDSGQIKLETENITEITWADYPDGPDEYVFQVDSDVHVIVKDDE